MERWTRDRRAASRLSQEVLVHHASWGHPTRLPTWRRVRTACAWSTQSPRLQVQIRRDGECRRRRRTTCANGAPGANSASSRRVTSRARGVCATMQRLRLPSWRGDSTRQAVRALVVLPRRASRHEARTGKRHAFQDRTVPPSDRAPWWGRCRVLSAVGNCRSVARGFRRSQTERHVNPRRGGVQHDGTRSGCTPSEPSVDGHASRGAPSRHDDAAAESPGDRSAGR